MSATETLATQFEPQKQTLIRHVEVWTPNDGATKLRLVSAQTTDSKVRRQPAGHVAEVAMGEGLAGCAWEQKSVSIANRQQIGELDLTSTAHEVDLAASLAIPVFCRQEIRGVVVLGLSEAFGGAEVWDRDDRDELAVSASHYSGLKSFAFISRYTRFPKGAGVQGRVWQSGLPDLLQNLGHGDSFIPSFGNDLAEISTAICLPIGQSRGFPASVLLLLSSPLAPLASLVELWNCEPLSIDTDEAGQVAPQTRLLSASTAGGEMKRFDAETSPQDWQSELLKLTTAAGQPILRTTAETELPLGAAFNLSIPLFRNGVLRSVLNLMF